MMGPKWMKTLLERLREALGKSVHYMGGGEALPSPLSPEEEEEAMERLTRGDLSVKSTLIERNLRPGGLYRPQI